MFELYLPNVTLTKKLHTDDNVFASVNTYLTSVLPTGKDSPGLAVVDWVNVLPSVAVGAVQVATADPWKLLVTTFISPCGQLLIRGGARSTVMKGNKVCIYQMDYCNINIQQCTLPINSASRSNWSSDQILNRLTKHCWNHKNRTMLQIQKCIKTLWKKPYQLSRWKYMRLNSKLHL